MNRGAKIVIVAVVALFALTGIYYAFSSPKSRTTASRDADSGSAESATGRISDPIAPGASVPQTLTMGPATGASASGSAATPPDTAFAKSTAGTGTAPGTGSPALVGGTGANSTALGAAGATAGGTPNSLAPVIAPPTGSSPMTTGSPRILPPERTAVTPPNTPSPATAPSINPPAPASPTTTAKTSPSVAPASGTTKYTIKAGDTFSTIAGDFYKDTRKWSVIAKANPGVDPARLKVGQVINVPTDGAVARQATTVPERASAVTRPGGTTHTVATGETLSAIAERYLGSKGAWKRLYEANKDAIGSDPAKLKVGTKLVIPAA
jgi:nucleoid-associated protein YgaU